MGSKVTTSAYVWLDSEQYAPKFSPVPIVMPTRSLSQQKYVPSASYMFHVGSAPVGDSRTVLVQLSPIFQLR